jgi:RNA polymerase sigma factor for flagellar operon FliA
MYTATGTSEIDKEQFIIEFTPLVKRIAYHMLTRLPASVQVDDLIQAGMIGLLDAVSRYEGSYGRQFESYAAQRIRGSILDELREADWLPRSIRKKMRSIETAVSLLEQRNGCPPSEQELAKELNMTLDEYHETLQSARSIDLLRGFSAGRRRAFSRPPLLRFGKRPAQCIIGRQFSYATDFRYR